MDNRSRVWPISVDSLINLEPSFSSNSISIDKNQPKRVKFKKPLNINHYSKIFICGSTASDICFVAGAILTIIGALVASLGIYPNNQVSFKLTMFEMMAFTDVTKFYFTFERHKFVSSWNALVVV